MNRTIIALAILLCPVAAVAQSTVIGPDGTTYRRSGNVTYGSDGSTFIHSGNATFGSDGTTYLRSGNTTFGSDGSSSTRVGNSTMLRDRDGNNSMCHRIGSTTLCD